MGYRSLYTALALVLLAATTGCGLQINGGLPTQPQSSSTTFIPSTLVLAVDANSESGAASPSTSSSFTAKWTSAGGNYQRTTASSASFSATGQASGF